MHFDTIVLVVLTHFKAGLKSAGEFALQATRSKWYSGLLIWTNAAKKKLKAWDYVVTSYHVWTERIIYDSVS